MTTAEKNQIPMRQLLRQGQLRFNQMGSSLSIGQHLFSKSYDNITDYEELTCVGFDPDRSRIIATVHIKKESGYAGGTCSEGSTEYVRYFLDFLDNQGYKDQGVSSFTVNNISDLRPGPQHPISHSTYINIDDDEFRQYCEEEVLIKIRAILSWNTPPSNDPNELPLYGNRIDAYAILRPTKPPILFSPSNAPAVGVASTNSAVLEYTVESLQKLEYYKIDSLLKNFKNDKVSKSRVLDQLSTLKSYLQPHELVDYVQNNVNLEINEEDWLNNEEFNTNYEELECIGYNGLTNELTATIRIKQPFGYSGNLCTVGSSEYVSFFVDYQNKSQNWEYLGYSSVNVHDIKSIPDEGLLVTVTLRNSDLLEYLDHCSQNPIVRIRAILSWQRAITSANSSATWGNMKESLVQLRPSKGECISFYSLGLNIPILSINADGYSSYGTRPKENIRPFGGNIQINGSIQISRKSQEFEYRIEFSDDGGNSFKAITQKQKIDLRKLLGGGTFINYNVDLIPDPEGWMPFLGGEDASGYRIEVLQDKLGIWDTRKSINKEEGLCHVRLSCRRKNDANSSVYLSKTTPIYIDNKRYEKDDSFDQKLSHDLDLYLEKGDCQIFSQGDEIKGYFRVADNHHDSHTLKIVPKGKFIPLGTSEDAVVVIHYNNGVYFDPLDPSKGYKRVPFTIHSKYLQKCGYVLRLRGIERTIFNPVGRNGFKPITDKTIGFTIN